MSQITGRAGGFGWIDARPSIAGSPRECRSCRGATGGVHCIGGSREVAEKSEREGGSVAGANRLRAKPTRRTQKYRGLTPPRSPEAANIDGGRRKRRWLVTAATLSLLLIAGIFIKLETDKGQLVIQSEVANVKVRIIHDGQPVSGLSTEPIQTKACRAPTFNVWRAHALVTGLSSQLLFPSGIGLR